MPRIPTFATIDAATAASRVLLEAEKKRLGRAPNMFRIIANSPAALEVHLSGALYKGKLPMPTRERIALAVAEFSGCSYRPSAHTYTGIHTAKLEDAEITANRDGRSNDPNPDAAVRFAVKVVRNRGDISEEDLRAVKSAGYDDEQIIEIVAHIALNILTNYINLVAQTDIDFPAVTARKTV